MPQKRNSSGQLQNYVPAGNGDASGEYGTHASGGNKHYEPKETGTQNAPVKESGDKGFTKPDVPNIQKKMPENFKGQKKKNWEYQREVEKKIGGQTSLYFSGYSEEVCKQCCDAVENVNKDFPTLNNHLTRIGDSTEFLNEQYQKELELFNSKDHTEEIKKYQEKLLKWNSGKEFTFEQAKEIWLQYHSPEKKKEIRSPGSLGFCVSNKDRTESYISIKKSAFNEKDIISYQEDGWHLGKGTTTTVYHELGHSVHNDLFGSQLTSYRFSSPELIEIQKLYTETNEKYREIKGKMVTETYSLEDKRNENKSLYSEYGLTNVREFIAESFASHYTNQGANETAEKVFNLMKQAQEWRNKK